MEPLFWSLGIAASIYLSWNIVTKISSKIAGFSTVGFWLFWTLGGSAWFGFSVLTGPLFFVQMTVILVVFYLSYKMWKNKSLINDLKKDLKKIDNKILSSKLENLSNNEIKVLTTPKDHRKLLLQTLDTANSTIVIFSGWLTDYSVNNEFRNKLKNCLSRGVDIIIAWGIKNLETFLLKKKIQAKNLLMNFKNGLHKTKLVELLSLFIFQIIQKY